MGLIPDEMRTGVVMLLASFALVGLLAMWRPERALSALAYAGGVLARIAWVFVLVLALMGLINLLLTPKRLARIFAQQKGVRAWAFAIVGGIISSGPIYLWYPMLAELHERGMRLGLIATFLYNRAVKIPLLPLLIGYFGWHYAVLLSGVMVLASIVQGVMIERLVEV